MDNLLSAVNGDLVHHIKGALTFLTMTSRECSWLDPSYQRHITFACTGCYQLHPHHRLGIITLTYHRYQFTDHKRMDSLVSEGRLYAHSLCPRLLHNWIQRHRKEMNPGCQVQDLLDTSKPVAPYVKAREINLWTCWAIGESNPRPFARTASGLTTGPPRLRKNLLMVTKCQVIS